MYSLHFDLLLKVFLFSHHYIDAFYMQGQIHSFSIRGVRTHLKVFSFFMSSCELEASSVQISFFSSASRYQWMLYGSFFVTIIINSVTRQYLLLIYYFLHSLYNIFITGSNLWSKWSQSLIRNFKSPIGLWGGGVVVGKNELCKPFTSPHLTFKVNLWD